MTDRQQYFFQQIKIGSKEVPIQSVSRGVYIEALNLDGPQLILMLNDTDSSLRDDLGLVDGVKLSVKMGDPNGRGDAYFSVDFVVVHVRAESTQIRVEALEATMHALKQPVTRPMVFNQMRPAAILTSLFPGYKVQSEAIKDKLTYHVTMGATPSSVLRIIQRDLGAAIWVARGTVYCIPYAMLGNQKETYPVFEYQSQASMHPIFAYAPMHKAEAAKRTVQRCYMSWDTTKGMMMGTKHPDAPRAYLPNVPFHVLDNAAAHAVPYLLCDMHGNGTYTPGMTVGIQLHRHNQDRVVDESMPRKQMIMTVSHIQERSAYKCKVTTGVSQV